MKLTIFLFFLGIAQLLAVETYSQNTRLSLDFKSATIKDVLAKIEEKSEFFFLYNSKLIDVDRTVSGNFKNQSISEVLDKLFQESDVVYTVVDRQIVLTNKEDQSGFLESINSHQQKSVSGKVTDSSGSPLPGVSVVVKGTTTGNITDVNGNYSLLNVPENATLQFSFVGMKGQEVAVGGKTTVNIKMEEEMVGIEEVVAIGYGTQKKVNLTAAVDVIDMQTLENRPIVSVTQMLEGSIANLNVTTTSGAPGETSTLNIRGFTGRNSSGSPLIMVDGVPQDIEYLNPNDIESISVLKDAAASAIYGSRAPNGVLIITTKSGKKNTDMKFNYSGDIRISSPLNMPKMLNSYDFVNINNEWNLNSMGSPEYSAETVQRIKDYIDGKITDNNIIQNGKFGGPFTANANEDFFETVYREVGVDHSHNFSINGGGDQTSYYAGIGHIKDQGIYDSPVDKHERTNLTFKIDTDINKWFNLKLNTRYSRYGTIRPNFWGGGDNDKNFMDVMTFRPNIPSINRVGEYEGVSEFSLLPALIGDGGKVNRITDNFLVTFNGEIKLLDGLKIKGAYTWNIENRNNQITHFKWACPEPNGTFTPSRRSVNLEKLEKRNSNSNYQTLDMTTTYTKTWGKHDLTSLIGYQHEINDYEELYASNTDFYTTTTPSFSTMYGDNQIVTDALYGWATQGFFGRVSYNYEGRYLFDFNARYDATSRYSKETRWAFFPSFSAGYNIAKEKFWPLKDQVSMFKFRGSWGKLGNAGTGRPRYLAPLGTGAQIDAALGGSRPPFVSMPAIISPELTWEKPRTFGLGLEIAALNNRLSLNYDWYQRTVFDEVGVAEQLPSALGTSAPPKNNAVSETRGWEVSVKWQDKALKLRGDNVYYNIKLVLSDYVGYVVEYSDASTGTRSGWTPGQQFGIQYGYKSLGIQTSADDLQNKVLPSNNWYYPGDLIYEDRNGDGRIDSGIGEYWYSEGDRIKLGYTYPRYKYGIVLGSEWKGFSLNVLLDGVGHQVEYVNDWRKIQYTSGQGTGTRSLLDFHGELGYWNMQRQDAFFPRTYALNSPKNNFYTSNDQYLTNYAHLRIKNINFSYNIPKTLISRAGIDIDYIAINFSVENAGMIYYKSYSKIDPTFLQNTSYPLARTFSIGLNFGL